MVEAVVWFLKNLALGVVNFFSLFTNPEAWPDFSDKLWLSRLIYYGGSVELFFIVIDIFLIVLVIGLWKREFLWSVVRGVEKINNTIGRWGAWALLLMVLQQVMIVALQRIFRVSEITIGPFGYAFTKDLSWFSEELKFYNAILVTICCAYTFIQGGHVRVDLVYGALRFRTKRVIDMLGALFFILPFMTFVWMFGWYFMWRHLVRGTIAYNKDLTHYERVSKILKWNVETIAFSPNGFNAYFLFKVLLVMFAGLMFLQGMAYFYRCMLEFIEGPKAEDKYLDKDSDHEPPPPNPEGAGAVLASVPAVGATATTFDLDDRDETGTTASKTTASERAVTEKSEAAAVAEKPAPRKAASKKPATRKPTARKTTTAKAAAKKTAATSTGAAKSASTKTGASTKAKRAPARKAATRKTSTKTAKGGSKPSTK